MYSDQYLRVTVNTAILAINSKMMVFTFNRDNENLEPWIKALHGSLAYCQGLFILTEELFRLNNEG